MKELVAELLEKALEENESLFLIDFSVSEGNQIKVVIDGDKGVTVNDCIIISRAIEHNIDRDEIDFSLDVSSAGVSEPLLIPRQYLKNIGRNLKVITKNNDVCQGKLEKANEKKIKQIIKPAIESLKELKNSSHIFDLIFIDADKENYLKYYDICIKLINTNGLIIIDNVLWHGEVADNTKNDKFTNIIRDFNKYVKEDNRVIKNIIPIGDGLTICIKK